MVPNDFKVMGLVISCPLSGNLAPDFGRLGGTWAVETKKEKANGQHKCNHLSDRIEVVG